MLRNEDGVRFTSASEWLHWRDTMVSVILKFPEEHAELLGRNAERTAFTDRVAMVKGFAAVVAAAEIVVWEDEQWSAATNGLEAWEGTAITPVPMVIRPQVWTWPGDRSVPEAVREAFGLEDQYDLTAMLVTPVRAQNMGYAPIITGPPHYRRESHGRIGWSVAWIFGPSEKWAGTIPTEAFRNNVSLMLNRLRIGPAVYPGSRVANPEAALFACRAFMDMDLVELTPQPTTRQQRRAYERTYPERCSSVQTVSLRRLVRPSNGNSGQHGDYHCRWWVKGHWRRRNERWSSSDAPIWVKPHIKGPDDAPIKPVTERLIHVNR